MRRDKLKIGCYVLSLMLVALASTFASCTKEQLLPSEQLGKEYMDFSLELTPPGDFTLAGTRSLNDIQQNALSRAAVLVFEKNILIYQKTGAVTDVDGKKTLQVELKTSQSEKDLYDIMVIGNQPTDFIFESYVGKTKDDLKAALNVSLSGKWTDSEFIMYGEVLQTLIKPITNHFRIQMLRSLARVDIGLGTYDETTGTWSDLSGDFALSEVRVVNSRNKFAVIPSSIAFNENGNVTVSEPTIPTDAGLQGTTAADAIRYSGLDVTHSYTQSTIFLAEAPNTTDRVILLVGGSYKGATNVSYYRIDFVVPKAGDPYKYDYLPILRNHLYRINIVKVLGEGFSTPEEALLAAPINMVTELQPIDEAGTGNVVFDSDSYLYTNASNILIYGNPDGKKTYNIATVKACFTTGATTTVTGFGITSPINLKSGESTPLSIVIPDKTASGNYTIKIKVGKLTKEIPVTLQPAVDAHFDFLPFQNVSSITIETPQKWLTLSQSTIYVKNDQQSPQISGNSAGKACFHFDENITTTGDSRMAQALVRRSDNQTTYVCFEQRDLKGLVLGHFGQRMNDDGYNSLLAVESLEEFSDRVYDDTSIGTITEGMQWGFFDRSITNAKDRQLGASATYTLSNLSGSGISGAYTIYNNYAARYCFDKNRDRTGDGIVTANEVVWYLPARDQLVGAWIAKNGLDTQFAPSFYRTATDGGQSESWAVSFSDGSTSYYLPKAETYRVRCVRDL